MSCIRLAANVKIMCLIAGLTLLGAVQIQADLSWLRCDGQKACARGRSSTSIRNFVPSLSDSVWLFSSIVMMSRN